MDAVTVRVGKLPGTLSDVALEGGATVADALREAGLSAEGHQIRVNGTNADASRTLAEGDTVLLTRQIKGNQTVVRAGRLPGTLANVAVEDGATIQDVLSAAGLSTEGHQVRLNGESAELDAEVEDGDTILLTRQIKGNLTGRN